MNYWGVINKKTNELENYRGRFAVYSDRQSARNLAGTTNEYIQDNKNKVTVKKVLVTVID
jgi:hypothetical protein